MNCVLSKISKFILNESQWSPCLLKVDWSQERTWLRGIVGCIEVSFLNIGHWFYAAHAH